jgi:O-antigen ligase/tetratricopeptide (TPR) repeat protein
VSRWAGVLERAGLAAAVAGVALRWGVSGVFAGTGLNLFIHLLPVLGLAAWFAGRGLAGGATWRFTGAEAAVLALALVHAVSAARASHKLPALEAAVGYLAYGIVLVAGVQALGRDGLRTLLLAGAAAAIVLALVQYVWTFPATAARVAGASPDLVHRHATREPFAAFTGPNQLAAFLVLALPIALGAAIDARPRGLAALAPPAVVLALGALVLVLTGSLGGWVSSACGAAAFAGLALTCRRGRPALVAAGAAAAALAVALALFTPLLEKAAARSHSLHVRRAYWTAAARVIAERPVLGVGLMNFEDHYHRVKGDVQQEVRQVHNDYLQVLAETGLVGFLGFAAFLAFGLRRAAAAEPAPAEDVAPPPSWLLPTSGAAAFLLLFLRYEDYGLLAAAAAWPLVAWAAGRTSSSGPWTRLGAAAGFVGLLVHLSVDFLWVEPGVALALCLGLALLLAYGPRLADVRLGTAACGGAALGLAVLGAPLFIAAGPALAAEQEVETARQLMARSPEAAAALAESAQRHNPLLADAYEAYAAAQFATARTDPLRIEAALQALDNAIALRPDHVTYRDGAAQLNLLVHRQLRKEAGEVARARAAAYLARAREHLDAAVALYPAHARRRYDRGRVLDLLGEREEASKDFAEALRFSDLAARELENRPDLQLGGVRRIRALARAGRTAEAAREAKRLLPLDGQGDVRRLLEMVRATPTLLSRDDPDEIDEVTRPLIDAAIDEALKGR